MTLVEFEDYLLSEGYIEKLFDSDDAGKIGRVGYQGPFWFSFAYRLGASDDLARDYRAFKDLQQNIINQHNSLNKILDNKIIDRFLGDSYSELSKETIFTFKEKYQKVKESLDQILKEQNKFLNSPFFEVVCVHGKIKKGRPKDSGLNQVIEHLYEFFNERRPQLYDSIWNDISYSIKYMLRKGMLETLSSEYSFEYDCLDKVQTLLEKGALEDKYRNYKSNKKRKN